MKLRNILLNSAVGVAALLFGLAWVGVYQYFTGQSVNLHTSNCSNLTSSAKSVSFERLNFDINDSESVLPIDFEEDKLSDPKSDENNVEYFDPEGTYFALDKLPSEFGSFESFTISNKTLEFDDKGSYTVEDIAPEGFAFDSKMHKFQNLEIKDGKISFETKETTTGVSFSFEGRYLVTGNFYTLDANAEVVRGTLTKMSGNKKTVLNEFTFGWMIDFE